MNVTGQIDALLSEENQAWVHLEHLEDPLPNAERHRERGRRLQPRMATPGPRHHLVRAPVPTGLDKAQDGAALDLGLPRQHFFSDEISVQHCVYSRH